MPSLPRIRIPGPTRSRTNDEIRIPILREVVIGHLDRLDTLVTDADNTSRAALADTELARMTAAWRALLGLHQPDAHGRCPQCSRRRRGRRFPCSVWVVAHQHLIADGPPSPRPHPHPHATAAGHPSSTAPAAS